MTEKILRLILGDQLNASISSLDGFDKNNDIVLICEVWDETQYVRHHKKKIAFLFSAMRHFAADLNDQGFQVDYIKLDDDGNSGSFQGEVERAITRHSITKIIVTEPSEYRVLEIIKSWPTLFQMPVEIRQDKRFIATHDDFYNWAKGKKQLRMEFFYREMRLKTRLLMNHNNKPEGGEWNYDANNRNPLPQGITPPPPLKFECDAITEEVKALVAQRFSNHFGDIEPFHYAVTREQAIKVLDHFIENRLKNFGQFQDAMKEGEPWMYHSHISFYLNCGLLTAFEVCKSVENAYYNRKDLNIPLNAAEGFIRQIIGWREYIRGIYWYKMPDYADENFLMAKRMLPEFFWTGKTKLNCMKQCINETKQNAYAHHIQRLMVIGNFCLLTGIDPQFVNEWYLIVYADAYEWVEMPNVTGMILYADGGVVASKPYAAGSNYINKMSDYCKNCIYSPEIKTGPNACPFNYMYWDFMIRNRDVLHSNPRIGMIYSTLDKMKKEKASEIQDNAQKFLDDLSKGFI